MTKALCSFNYFDLFGTLVDNVTDAVYHTYLRETAGVLEYVEVLTGEAS